MDGLNLDATPGMEPPQGLVSQFHQPYNNVQNGTVISFGVTFFFATALLCLRFFQATRIHRKFELDLLIFTLSWGMSMMYFLTLVHQMRYGWGSHLWDVPMADLIEFNKGLLHNTVSYLITPSLTKMAMLVVLYQINPSRSYRLAVVGIAVSIFAYTLTLASITGGPCNPLRAGTTKCLENVALAHSVLNIASDLAVIAVPIPTLHNLQFTLKQKVSVGLLLGLGSGVVICSIARLPYVLVLDNSADVTYTEGILGIWSLVEVNLGIICGCAMRLKTVVVRYLPQLSAFFSASRMRTADQGHSSSNGGLGKRYQLHSIQKGGRQQAEGAHASGIRGKCGGTGSTDTILS